MIDDATGNSYEPIPLKGGSRFPVVSLPSWLYGKATPLELAVLGALQLHFPNIRPSIQRIADKAGLSRRTAFKTLDDLERKGWVLRTVRSTEDGRSLPNSYELRIWPTDEQMAKVIGADQEPVPAAARGGCRTRTLGVQEMHPQNDSDWRVQEMHPQGAPDARGRVQEMHPQGAPDAPEGLQEQEIQEQEERPPLSPASGGVSTGLPVDGLCPDPDGPPPKPPAKPKDRFASKVLPADVIPDDLLDCQQLLPEWWSVKAKGRTEVAFTRACAFLRKYAPDERQLVLETAIMGGHQGLYPPREDRQAPGRFLSERERNRAACDRLADAIDNGGFLL